MVFKECLFEGSFITLASVASRGPWLESDLIYKDTTSPIHLSDRLLIQKVDEAVKKLLRAKTREHPRKQMKKVC